MAAFSLSPAPTVYDAGSRCIVSRGRVPVTVSPAFQEKCHGAHEYVINLYSTVSMDDLGRNAARREPERSVRPHGLQRSAARSVWSENAGSTLWKRMAQR